jgi:protein-S-isoprenylcysteine O-methyltransferase Ste14
MKSYQRVFGSGPTGFLVSVALLGGARWIRPLMPGGPLFERLAPRVIIVTLSGALTLAIVVWSLRSLPVRMRGRGVCRSGPFRFVRHPLYAVFLSLFNFGFALYLNHWIYVLWAIVLHSLWHVIVRSEELLMVREFGRDYEEYMGETGRFVPRLGWPRSL